MDQKDQELLALLSTHGRADETFLSSRLGITPSNVDRRIKLLKRDGIVEGFSAFFDRRMFGFDTTYVKLHYRMRDLDRIVRQVMDLEMVSQVYVNMDDFMLVEIVHWDLETLRSSVRALERISSPMTVSSHYVPLLPDEIPETPRDADLALLRFLVDHGRASIERISSELGLEEDDVEERLSRLLADGVIQVRPLIREELVQPNPMFSLLVLMRKEFDVSAHYSRVLSLAKGSWLNTPLRGPPGVWLRCFGSDLHRMDRMIERFRREDFVEDVLLMIPDAVLYDRAIDAGIIDRSLR
ncbi:MAG: hypothetical protein DRN57_03600 [Thermoplasmata archaeon]|nr:MAG: hypothetical protein DRN57_03600 [Thermoplasmata archaeon]